MSEHQSAPSVRKLVREDPDPADPAFVAKLQQAANLANENCDRAMALAHKLSSELREAHDRINQTNSFVQMLQLFRFVGGAQNVGVSAVRFVGSSSVRFANAREVLTHFFAATKRTDE